MGALHFLPGDTVTRAEVKTLYGGGTQRGIEASATTPNVFVYSDPSEGEKFGYNFDGWDADGSVFRYTGEGALGDQKLVSGNRAILQHREDRRSLHLFVMAEDRPTGGKLHRYLGEFEVDAGLPYKFERAPDRSNQDRAVVVFNLRPVGWVHRDDDKDSQTPSISRSVLSELVGIEAQVTDEFVQSAIEARVARRIEAALVDRYVKYLREDLEHDVQRNRIWPPGDASPLYTDLYDVTEDELYEAKGTPARGAVRAAIGQLLDYRRHIEKHQRGRELVLLPVRPSLDLVELIHSCGMSCVFGSDDGSFVRLDPAASHFQHPSAA